MSGHTDLRPLASIQRGAAFPSTPATGDRCWRTDRGIEYYWDGTRWLSTQLFTVTAVVSGNATANAAVVLPHPGARLGADVYLVNLAAYIRLNTATTSANYFTANLRTYSAGGVATIQGGTITSANATLGAFVSYATALNTLLPLAAAPAVELRADKFGTHTTGAAISVEYSYRLVG